MALKKVFEFKGIGGLKNSTHSLITHLEDKTEQSFFAIHVLKIQTAISTIQISLTYVP